MQVNIPYIKSYVYKNPISSIILSTTRTGPANLWRQIEDFFLKNEYSRKTNMSHENQWLEDVFPIEIVPF